MGEDKRFPGPGHRDVQNAPLLLNLQGVDGREWGYRVHVRLRKQGTSYTPHSIGGIGFGIGYGRTHDRLHLPTDAASLTHLPTDAASLTHLPIDAASLTHLPIDAGSLMHLPTDAASLTHLLWEGERMIVRQQVLLNAGDEDMVKLEPLGRVHRHQLDGVGRRAAGALGGIEAV